MRQWWEKSGKWQKRRQFIGKISLTIKFRRTQIYFTTEPEETKTQRKKTKWQPFLRYREKETALRTHAYKRYDKCVATILLKDQGKKSGNGNLRIQKWRLLATSPTNTKRQEVLQTAQGMRWMINKCDHMAL